MASISCGIGVNYTRTGVSGGSSFTPTDISGLQLWVRPEELETIGDGNPIGTWADQSGNGNDLVQATESKKPLAQANILNGFYGGLWDGSDDFLRVTFGASISQPVTIIYVADLQEHNLYYSDSVGGTDRIAVLGQSSGGKRGQSVFAGAQPSWTENGFNLGDPHIWVTRVNGTSSFLRIDGTDKAGPVDAGTNSLDGVSLGTRYTDDGFFSGHFFEVLFYDADVSGDDLTDLETYLNDRYAIF